MVIERAAAALAAVILLCACATTPATPDLAVFLERRAVCDHFRGEIPDPPAEERMREVLQKQGEYCTGTDAQLALLKKRWHDDPAVMKQLDELEPQIEAPSP